MDHAARLAGLSRNTLGKLEKAALPNPNLSTLLALMEIYETTSLEDLLGPLPSQSLLDRWVGEGRPGLREDQGSATPD